MPQMQFLIIVPPALNKVVEIAIKLDELTDEASSETVRNMVVCTVAGFVVIIVCLVFCIYFDAENK